MNQSNLIDIYRTLHQEGIQYTNFSSGHEISPKYIIFWKNKSQAHLKE